MTMSLAKKLEGNATHPISQGALCPRGQASIQITYHPDRLIQPLKRRGARGSGDYQPISWDAAIAELVTQLDNVAGSGAQGLAALGRPGIRGTLIQVEPRMSLTGASADEWIGIRPGTEGILALGLANALGAQNVGDYTLSLIHI